MGLGPPVQLVYLLVVQDRLAMDGVLKSFERPEPVKLGETLRVRN